jgi:hypothetical protein
VDCFTQTCSQEEEFRKYWGGDVRGIDEKLDYIERLGASAIWVTPLAENVRMYEGGTGYGTGYHGYWVQNYYQVNPHFGGWTDVEDFSLQLHMRGMRYIQDITLNDSNPLDNHVYGRVYNAGGSIFVRSYDDDFDRVYGGRFYKHYQNTPQCKNAPPDDADWNYWQLAVYDAPVDYQPLYINSGSDDPWNRPGMKNWDETTPAFRIISALACLRKNDPAVWRGTYNTLYSDPDVLIYERVAGNDIVLVAVNRGPAKDIALRGGLGFVPGTYRGLIADASSANARNYVRIGKQASLAHLLGAISALALRN